MPLSTQMKYYDGTAIKKMLDHCESLNVLFNRNYDYWRHRPESAFAIKTFRSESFRLIRFSERPKQYRSDPILREALKMQVRRIATMTECLFHEQGSLLRATESKVLKQRLPLLNDEQLLTEASQLLHDSNTLLPQLQRYNIDDADVRELQLMIRLLQWRTGVQAGSVRDPLQDLCRMMHVRLLELDICLSDHHHSFVSEYFLLRHEYLDSYPAIH